MTDQTAPTAAQIAIFNQKASARRLAALNAIESILAESILAETYAIAARIKEEIHGCALDVQAYACLPQTISEMAQAGVFNK